MTVPFKTQFFSQPNISSAHILDRTITTSDIALGTIDISNLSTACIASLTGGLTGLITIKNLSKSLTNFTYLLYYRTSSVDTIFASYEVLKTLSSASHYFVMPTPSSLIRIEVMNNDGITVDEANIIYGATVNGLNGNIFDIQPTLNNILVYIEVVI